MFKIEWPNFWRGKLDINVTGSRMAVTLFLNQAVQANLQLQNVHWISANKIHMTIQLTDFYQVVRLLKKCKCKMRIQKKTGFPFIVNNIRAKKFFYFGVLLFAVLLFLLSSFIWKVDVEGVDDVPEEEVRSILKQEGIYMGQIKYRLPNQETLKQRLLSRIPEAAWVGLQIEGTRILITVVEKKQVEKLQEELPSYGPVHLIAEKDAMITDVQVEKGNPLVGSHDVVTKGDLLVSGIYGDLEEETKGNIIGAKGKVFGEVWYDAEVEIPINQNRKEFTGAREKIIHPFIGRWILKNPFFSPKFRDYELVEYSKPVILGNVQLPFGWIEREYLQMKKTKVKLSITEARIVGLRRAQDELRHSLGKDGKILVEKVLHQRLESGKVYLKIHFDVIENIAVPKPILQGE